MIDYSLVCRLKKLLYSLKQAPHDWYEKINHFFFNLGFKSCEYSHNIYILHLHGEALIVALYVDDLVITRNNVSQFWVWRNNLHIHLKWLILVSYISFWEFKFCKWIMVSFFLNLNILWIFWNDSRWKTISIILHLINLKWSSKNNVTLNDLMPLFINSWSIA